MEDFEDYEPTDEELIEMEKLIREAEEEARDIEGEEIRKNRIFYAYPDFDSFRKWLKENGIRW